MSGARSAQAPFTRHRRALPGLLAAEAVSLLGTRISMVALPWFVLVTTGSAARTGLVAFAEMLPYVLIGGLGGPLVDRVGARRVAISADTASTGLVGLIPLLHGLDLLGFPGLLALVAAAGTARGLGDNAKRVLIPGAADLSGTPIERATGWQDGVNRLASLLGGPVGGLLVSAVDVGAALAVDAATFAVAALIVRSTVPQAADPEPSETPEEYAGTAGPVRRYLSQLAEGFAFLRSDRLLMGIAAMVLVTNLVDQAYSAVLLPVWVRDELGSAAALGAIFGVFGAGAVLGNTVFGWLGPRLPRHATYSLCFLLCGCPRFFVLWLGAGFAIVLAVAFTSGLGAGAINPILAAVEYERVPRHLQARVLGAVGALAWAGIPLGALLAGWAATGLGLGTALLAAGVVYLVATLVPFVFPSWRGMDRAVDRSAA